MTSCTPGWRPMRSATRDSPCSPRARWRPSMVSGPTCGKPRWPACCAAPTPSIPAGSRYRPRPRRALHQPARCRAERRRARTRAARPIAARAPTAPIPHPHPRRQHPPTLAGIRHRPDHRRHHRPGRAARTLAGRARRRSQPPAGQPPRPERPRRRPAHRRSVRTWLPRGDHRLRRHQRADVERLLARIPPSARSPPSSTPPAVMDNGLIDTLDAERLRRVMAPKLDAAIHLHEFTRDLDLSEFILFSSGGAALGQPRRRRTTRPPTPSSTPSPPSATPTGSPPSPSPSAHGSGKPNSRDTSRRRTAGAPGSSTRSPSPTTTDSNSSTPHDTPTSRCSCRCGSTSLRCEPMRRPVCCQQSSASLSARERRGRPRPVAQGRRLLARSRQPSPLPRRQTVIGSWPTSYAGTSPPCWAMLRRRASRRTGRSRSLGSIRCLRSS